MPGRLLVFAALAFGGVPSLAEPSPEAVTFFETKIRPILVAQCYECHAQDSKIIQGGLVLDSRDGWVKGGDTGPSLEPGKPDDSLLIKAIRYEDDSPQMPPKGKLPQSEIDLLTEWVRMGAPDPRSSQAAKTKSINLEEGKNYWAFQPLTKPAIPEIALARRTDAATLAHHSVDAFVHAKQLEKGLHTSRVADAETLVRRIYLDLTGLPPTADERNAFLEDWSADRIDRLVDRVLASPRMGERWARHWLDVARFAESFGFEHDYDRPFAYHFRDFVIRAFNENLPYDQFVKWQIAGDELAPENPMALMATGFLGAGVFPTQITANEVERTRYDALDDMLATVGSSMLGLSVGCARCHDHKFDPIPSRDYYRMLTTFTTTVRSEIPVDMNPAESARKLAEWQTARAPLADALDHFEQTSLRGRFESRLRERPLTSAEYAWILGDSVEVKAASAATITPQTDGSFLVGGENPATETYTFTIKTSRPVIHGLRLEALPDLSLPLNGPGRASNGNFGLTKIEVTSAAVDAPKEAQPVGLGNARSTFDQKDLPAASAILEEGGCWAIAPQIGRPHAMAVDFTKPLEANKPIVLTVTLMFRCNEQHSIGRPRISLGIEKDGSLAVGPTPAEAVSALERLTRGDSFDQLSDEERQRVLAWHAPQDDEWSRLHEPLARHDRNRPQPATTKVMVASEGFTPIRWHTQGADFFEKTYFLKRGDTNLKDGEASQGFLRVLMRGETNESYWQEAPPKEGRTSYRRRSFAHWLTDVEQGAGSLLARVIVNRLWQHHLGRGIVSTPNDFGLQGEKPTHPELLEWLAAELVENGWNLKDLHRAIVTSQVYQQSSEFDSAMSAIDRENLYLWRFAPRRAEAEVVRDAVLFVSGSLDTAMYGPGTLDPSHKRRSIYFTMKRSQLPNFLLLFDAPDTLTSLGRRSQTTTAPQALAFLNDPLVRASATQLGAELTKAQDADEGIESAYLRLLGRVPNPGEKARAASFLLAQREKHQSSAPGEASVKAWADVVQVLLALNEFIYLD